jgi:Flp pilus assembly protein TadD
MLNAAEVTNHLNFEFIRERAWALWLMPVGFGAVLPLAVIGVAAARRGRRERAIVVLLGAIAVVTLLSVVLFTVADRYRAPMVLPLIVLAGAGVAVLADLARRRATAGTRAAAVVLAAGLAAALIAHVPLVKSLRGRDHWMFAEAWLAKGRLAEAIAEYEAGAREEPMNGPLLNNLATAYRRAGRHDDALAVLRRLVAIEPRLAYPHKNLGMMLIRTGDHHAALAALHAAHALDSLDAEVVGAIGALHAEEGDRARASEHFARALALAPGDARLRALAAHYQFAPAGP